MRTTMKLALGATVVAAMAGMLGGSYWAGVEVEARFRARAAQVGKSNPHVAIEVLEYERGWFGARAKTTLRLKHKPDWSGPVFDHVIEHGPLSAWAVVGRIHSEVRPPDMPDERNERHARGMDVIAAFGGKPPLTVDSVMTWDGKLRHRFVVPRFEHEQESVKIHWAGSEGEIVEGSEACCMQVNVDFPGLTLEGKFDYHGVDMVFQARMGHASMEIDKMRDTLRGHFDLDDFSMEYDHGSSLSLHLEGLRFAVDGVHDAQHTAFWTGSIETGVRQATLSSVPHATLLRLENYRNRLGLSAENQVARLWHEISLDKLSFDSSDTAWLAAATGDRNAVGLTLDRPRLNIALENLDAEAIATLIDGVVKSIEAHDSEATAKRKGAEWARKHVVAFLRRQPALVIRDSGLGLNGRGAARLDLRLAYVGDLTRAFDPATDIVGELDLRVPRELVWQVFKPGLLAARARIGKRRGADPAPDDQEIQDTARELKALSEQLTTLLIDDGWVKDQDGMLAMTIDYRDGGLKLNGVPLEAAEQSEKLKRLKALPWLERPWE
jgi:uncharacterized protein YdgA (DUF945 family)